MSRNLGYVITFIEKDLPGSEKMDEAELTRKKLQELQTKKKDYEDLMEQVFKKFGRQ